MNYEISDELWGQKDEVKSPQVDRVRFTPTVENDNFLKECKEKGFDISTIINLALQTFKPTIKSNGNTWEGIGRLAVIN